MLDELDRFCKKYPLISVLSIFIVLLFLTVVVFCLILDYMNILIDIAVNIKFAICTFLEVDNWGNFLPILITFYVGVLSFMIPISIQMIANIRKDFPTEEIEKKFKNELTFQWLPLLLISQIVFIGVININIEEGTAYPIILSLIMFFFIVISLLIYRHIKKMITYTGVVT